MTPIRSTIAALIGVICLASTAQAISLPFGAVPGPSDIRRLDAQVGAAPVVEDSSTANDQSVYRLDALGYGYGYELGQVPVGLPRGESTSQGWLTRWLSMGGEGNVLVHLDDSVPSHLVNVSLPHRPAAFPSHIVHPLPLSGYIIPFASLPNSTASGTSSPDRVAYACLPPLSPIGRPSSPPKPPGSSEGGGTRIVLIERGGCDFATKVRAAQERGAGAVIVGDGIARKGETDEEGRRRESLITMFSPEDTDSISIPSVFISRASYIFLRDLLADRTDSHRSAGNGLWVDLSEGSDETGALTSLLSFALLMPSGFLLITIAIHRFRAARQREADRAPPMVVLSLPERVWTPDIVWEKDDSASDHSVNAADDEDEVGDAADHANAAKDPRSQPKSVAHLGLNLEQDRFASGSTPRSNSLIPAEHLMPPPPINESEVRTPPAMDEAANHDLAAASDQPATATGAGKRKARTKRKYFSKDECAICMDSFARGDVVRILPCGHVFHKEECDEWLLKWRKLCPTCRADVTLPPGTAVQGSTLTPVVNATSTSEGSEGLAAHGPGHSIISLPGDAEDDSNEEIVVQHGSSWRRWNALALFRQARERIFGQRYADDSDGTDNERAIEGERTPLVQRGSAESV
ncbi:hypothetical protein IAU60_004958 [Kwoniella sp. DSM 27419]